MRWRLKLSCAGTTAPRRAFPPAHELHCPAVTFAAVRSIRAFTSQSENLWPNLAVSCANGRRDSPRRSKDLIEASLLRNDRTRRSLQCFFLRPPRTLISLVSAKPDKKCGSSRFDDRPIDNKKLLI